MKYRLLGRTGLQVSTLCLGTAFFGSYTNLEESLQIMQRALDAGVNFIDTANTYGDRRFTVASAPPDRPMVEEIVGRVLRGRRHEVILATKVCEPVGDGMNRRGLSRKFILEQVEISLKRLDTDFIDLYYAHHMDPLTPIEESLRAFDDLVHQGKVRYIGLSNYPAWRMMEALWMAERYRLASPVGIQIEYSMLHRSPESEQLPAAAAYGVGAMVFRPLASGILTGKYRADQVAPPAGSREALRREGRPNVPPQGNPAQLAAAGRLAEYAAACNQTPAQLALAWTLANRAVTAAIMGASSVAQLESNLPAFDVEMSAEESKALSEAIETLEA